MESRKLVQMILFAKQNRDTDAGNKCMDTKGEGVVVGGIGRLGFTYMHHCV